NEVNVTWRYNVVNNWMTEGIMMCFIGPGCVPNDKWFIYGNVWSNGNRVLEAQYATLGAAYLYDNTFVNLSFGVTGSHGNGGSFSGGVATNNLLVNASADWASWGISDSGNMVSSTAQFVDSAGGDYHLWSGASAINAGKAIAPVAGQSFDTDM